MSAQAANWSTRRKPPIPDETPLALDKNPVFAPVLGAKLPVLSGSSMPADKNQISRKQAGLPENPDGCTTRFSRGREVIP